MISQPLHVTSKRTVEPSLQTYALQKNPIEVKLCIELYTDPLKSHPIPGGSILYRQTLTKGNPPPYRSFTESATIAKSKDDTVTIKAVKVVKISY